MNYPKLSSPEYSFSVHYTRDNVSDRWTTRIDLVQHSSGKTKTFELAGAKNVDSMINHMNSLTDDLCAQWFAERKPSKKEKKNA